MQTLMCHYFGKEDVAFLNKTVKRLIHIYSTVY